MDKLKSDLIVLTLIFGICMATLGGCDNKTEQGKLNMARIDPCELVTQAEAQIALGVSVGKPIEDGRSTFDQCSYIGNGPRLADLASLTLQVHPVDVASLKKAYEVRLHVKWTPVSHLGEAAYWNAENNLLFVQKNGSTVSIFIQKNGTDNLKKAENLAKLALPRIP